MQLYGQALAVAFLGLTTMPSAALGLSFSFDYRFDDLGFFASPDRRTVLEQAGRDLASHFGDDLEAILPGGGNAWTARLSHPATGNAVSIADLEVPRDTLIVFVGGRELGTSEVGLAAPGTLSATGSPGWFDTIRYRGEALAAATRPTDFGPWGGSAVFDFDSSWYFDLDPGGIAGHELDFYGVALHELAHVMGFGLAPSWLDRISIGRFSGDAAVEAFGGLVPLSPGRDHWRAGTLGISSGTMQPAMMNPFIELGTRTNLTELDLAGLEDVGWTIVPEPGPLGLQIVPLAYLAMRSLFKTRSPD
jgi:hypothetical protein